MWMFEGKQRETWSHTAALLTLITNVNRDPNKGRPAVWADYYPFDRLEQAEEEKPRISFGELRFLMEGRTGVERNWRDTGRAGLHSAQPE